MLFADAKKMTEDIVKKFRLIFKNLALILLLKTIKIFNTKSLNLQDLQLIQV